MKTAVYRAYDGNMALLYVGCSGSPFRRISEHSSASVWAHSIATVKVAWFDCREAAIKAEAIAIITENPARNSHRPMAQGIDRTPEQRAELIAKKRSADRLRQRKSRAIKAGTTPNLSSEKLCATLDVDALKAAANHYGVTTRTIRRRVASGAVSLADFQARFMRDMWCLNGKSV